MRPDAARAQVEQIIRSRLGSVYTSRATMDDCVDKVMECAAQAAQRENLACYEIARSVIAPIGSTVDTRIIWRTDAAQDIAAAICARPPSPSRGAGA